MQREAGAAAFVGPGFTPGQARRKIGPQLPRADTLRTFSDALSGHGFNRAETQE